MRIKVVNYLYILVLVVAKKLSMLYARTRFILIILFFGLGVLLHMQIGFKHAWYLYASSILLLFTHFLFGSVWLAFNQLKKGNLSVAEKLTQQIKRPDWLIKSNRAYYYFTKGMIHLQQKHLEEGKTALEKALQIGLRPGNDQALACLNLAHIYYVQQLFDQSKSYLEQALQNQPNDLIIKDNIIKLETALAQLQ